MKLLSKLKSKAIFEKVDFDVYLSDWKKYYGEENTNVEVVRGIYDSIELPRRSTEGSAGYDFIMPFTFELPLNKNILVLTGIRCKMKKHHTLLIYPRSGQGTKHRLTIVNTVPVIDQDYYPGHILIKITYLGNNDAIVMNATENVNTEPEIYEDGTFTTRYTLNYKTVPSSPAPSLIFESGKAFAQGIVQKFYLSKHEFSTDDKKQIREGGFGSTDNK